MAVNFVTQAQRDSLIELYIGYFNRAPEGTGLNYWSQVLLTGLNGGKTEAATMKEIANQFYGAGVQFNLYSASQPVESFISTAYANALGRTSVDAAGMTYWTAKLNSGEVSRGEFVQSLIKDAKAFAGDATWGWVATYMANRVAVGNSFTDNSTNLTGDAAIAAGVSALSIVTPATAQAGQTAAQAVATFQANGVGSSSNTFTLTNGTDIKTAHTFIAGQVYTPGGDVRINALQDEDQLTGTVAMDDVLNATMGNALGNGGTVITPKLTSVEIVNAAFTGSGTAFNVTALDLQDATGLTEVNVTRVAQGKSAEVGNIKTAVAKMSLTDSNANQGDTVEFSFAANVLKGDNAATMTLKNVDLGTLNIGQNAGLGINGVGVATNGFETMTLNSTGSSNTVRSLNLPMDTGTAGKIIITGDQSLTLATTTNVTNLGLGEAVVRGGGISTTNGRLASVDASGMTGTAALTLNIAPGFLSTGKADTSGLNQDVTITGSANADTFYLSDTVQAGDSIVGGLGIDTLVVFTGGVTTGTVTGVEVLDIQLAGNVTMDMDKDLDAATIKIRNIDNTAGISADNGDWTVTLNNLSAPQAAALSISHSTTTNGAITDTTIVANLKSSTGATDLVGVTIVEGVNADPRFNFRLVTNAIESVTITDIDTESNTVGLASIASHTGTVTLKGGLVNTFLNLDTTTAGANGGMYQYDVTGATDLTSSNAGATVGRIADMSTVATQVRIGAEKVNAADEVSNVVVRVSTNAASTVGAQAITMGAGNDTVIFDNLGDNRAGLTISDTVVGGAGSDTLVIDGNVAITLGASEWTNVSGFETIRVVGNGVAANNAAGVTNSYNLTLTNNLLATNKDAVTGVLAIVSDNDLFNNTGTTAALAGARTVDGVVVANDAALNSGGVTIDARTLNAGSKWSFKGNEGAGGASADRIILSDANIDGNAVINGGALDNISNNRGMNTTAGNLIAANGGNTDVIEVRNAAVVSQGDLANVSNIGTLSFTNDTSITQVSTLQLNDSNVDSMVDSFQASASRGTVASATAGANVEILHVTALDNITPVTNVVVGTTGLNIEAGTLTDKSDLHVTLARGLNNVATGGGQDRVVLLGNYVAGTYTAVENGVSINAQSTPGAVARMVTDTINLGGGNDTLVTYGAINLTGTTLTGVETITANSALSITASQLNALVAANLALNLTGPVITFTGAGAHTLTIFDDVTGANTIDLSRIATTTGATLVVDTSSMFTAAGGGVNNTTSTGAVVNVLVVPVVPVAPVVPGVPVAPTGLTQVAVVAPGNTAQAGTGNFQFNVAAGTYTQTINGFGAGDVLALLGANPSVLSDVDNTDGMQQLIAVTPAGTVTITLTGLTGAQDAGVFNTGSFAATFGAGSLI